MSQDLLTKSHSKLHSIDFSERPHYYTRYNGGSNQNKRHPFISGYWMCLINTPETFTGNNYNNAHFIRFLGSTAESFTPPSRTLSKSDIIGFGGIKNHIITGQDNGDTFNITFREYQNLPIFSIFSSWANSINSLTGHITNKYKGQIAVALMKPVAAWDSLSNSYALADINGTKLSFENIFFFEGVMPENDPLNSFDSNIESNEGKVIEMTFSFDNMITDTFDFNSCFDEFKNNGVMNFVEPRNLPS